MEGYFIGSIIFEFIGVLSRWIYVLIIKKINGEKAISFSEVWKGRASNDFARSFGYGISNVLLGMIVMIIVLLILILILG